MGSIYRPKYKDRKGNIQQSSIWWIKYYTGGRAIRESSETADHAEARRLLKKREGEAAFGRMKKSVGRRVLFKELAELVENDYRINKFRTLRDIEFRFRLHILPVFGKRKAAQISEAEIDRYILQRRNSGAENATINRELAAIKRAFRLGIQKRLITDRPHINMLKENNVRQGFFEREQLRSVLKHLSDDLGAVARFAYITGWRRGEILPIQWPLVDFSAGFVRLEPGTTKNDEGRMFPFTPELRALLEAQRAKADALRKRGIICPWVFHRNGVPIREFKRAWETACKKAGLPGRIFHDFRRTAVRNLERAGVPRSVAMKMTGHKTESVYRRYDIVSEGDLKDAASKLEALSDRVAVKKRASAGGD